MSKTRTISPNPPADFTPNLGDYKSLQPFRYWCQKVLPLVYDDSLSYYELLCKVVDYLNKTMEDVETLHGDVTNLHEAYDELQSYVNDYFSTLDVQKEIDNKLDSLVEDGTLTRLISSIINPSPIMVDNISKMTNKNTIYVLSTTGFIYYYNNGAFVNSGLSYINNENYISRSLQMLTTDIALTLRDIPTNRAYAITSNSPNIFPVDVIYGGFLLKISPLDRDGFTSYILISPYETWFGYDDGENVVWYPSNIQKFNTVFTKDTFESEFGSNFSKYNKHAIIQCNGIIPQLGIELNGLYTVLCYPARRTSGYNIYFAISDTFQYIGFNNGVNIVWTDVHQSNKENIETYVSELKNKNIVFCGDSIVAGMGGSGYSPTGTPISNKPIHGDEINKRNESGVCWVNSMCTYLSNYNVSSAVNNGISGLNSSELLNHIAEIIPETTDIAIISIGTNDRNNLSLETTINNIKMIGEYCLQHNITPYFLTLIQSTSTGGAYSTTYEINDAIHTACKHSYSCFNMFSELNYYIFCNNIELNSILKDGLHPNDNGYNIMFNIAKKLFGL